MSSIVLIVVLLAALLHASWNFLVKSASDKHLSMACVVLGHAPFAVVALAVSPLPAWNSVPYIVVGAFLHCCYQIFLLNSYRFGDLSQVYPLARGVAPMLVACVSVVLLGVRLSPLELSAVGLIGMGIMSQALTRRSDGLRNMRGAVLAVTTGAFIASYSIVDGLGAREAGTSLGFYGWLSLTNALFFLALMRRRKGLFRCVVREHWRFAIVGGGFSFAAYALVTWAFTLAPIALVAALRETSIIFALLLGVLVLKEPLNLRKLTATFVTVLGVGLLRLSR